MLVMCYLPLQALRQNKMNPRKHSLYHDNNNICKLFVIANTFTLSVHVLYFLLLTVLQVMFYTLAVVTFGTAVPAGQFVPGIMIGSTYGRLVGMFVVSFYKKLNIEEGT